MSIIKNLCTAVAVGTILSTVGCGAASGVSGMTGQSLPNVRHHNKTVFVSVAPELGPEVLKAVQEAIWDSNSFKKVLQNPGADYDLEIKNVGGNAPAGDATDITIDLVAEWSLYDSNTRAVIMKKSISSTYTANMQWHLLALAVIPVVGIAMAGGDDYAKRYKRAFDGAVRENINQGLAAISELRLN